MKKFGTRKIVLYSVALFSALMLLVGLAFNVMSYDLGLGSDAGYALKKAGCSASGFSMMSFKLPTVLRSFAVAYLPDGYEFFELFIGILSLVTLVYSILSVCLIVLSFFKSKNQKGEKVLKTVLIFGLIISVVYAIVSVIFSVSLDSAYKESIKKLNSSLGSSSVTTIEDGFKTGAYATVIIQAVCLIAYFVCSAKIKYVEPVVGTESTSDKKATYTENSVKTGNAEECIDKLLSAETFIMDVLKEYKKLYEDSVITSVDYMDKKVKLLNASDKKIKQTISSLISKVSFEAVAQAELKVMKILRQYRKLAEEGVISDSDFVEKKVSLLFYII